MKLKHLPADINVQLYRLKLPARALKAFKAFGGGEAEMYPVGPVMGYGFMLSPDPASTGSRRLYPLPPTVPQQSMLNWTVVP